jgi:hypothetical protein
VSRFVAEEEALMKSLPQDQSTYQGKQFATAEEYGNMTPDQRAKHWRYTERDLARINSERASEFVKESIVAEEKRLEEFAKARGFTKANTPNGDTRAAAAPVRSPIPNTMKPDSPAGVVEQRNAPIAGAPGRGANSATSSFLERFRS